MQVETLVDITPPKGYRMPQDPKPQSAEPTKQIAVRVPKSLNGRLEDTADGLGLDVSSLVRMLLTAHLPHYERWVERIRRGEPPDQSPDVPESS